MAAIEQLFTEAGRLCYMRGLENQLLTAGFLHIAGVDEAGRGCLAGPVVAAAVIVDPQRLVAGVDDSKALTAEKRERLADAIKAAAVGWAIQQESPGVIDRINILEATRRAMMRAVENLQPAPDCVLVDAVRLGRLRVPSLALIRGDQVSYAVASASILAKVERDRLMCELDLEYPHYGFARHKGYGAAEHREALAYFGPSPAHRLSFRSVIPRRVVGTG